MGHALELLSGYEMAHGEAVALGCMAESYLSHALGYLPREELEEILALYRSLGYRFKKFDTEAFFEALSMDKKTEAGAARFVLIEKIGQCVPFGGEYCRTIPKQQIESLLKWMGLAF